MERQIDIYSINKRALQLESSLIPLGSLSNSIKERSNWSSPIQLCVQLESALIHLQRSVIELHM